MGIVKASRVAGTVVFCLLGGSVALFAALTRGSLAHSEFSFDEAMALVADGHLQPPGVVDDDSGVKVQAWQYVLAAAEIFRVSRDDPDRVRAVKDTLVREVARLDWDAYTELSNEYRYSLIMALGAIRDPGLIGFFMDYCQHSKFVVEQLAKLGETALFAAIQNLEDPEYAEPACMMLTLIEFVREIKTWGSVYSTEEKQRLLELIRRDGLPAFRSSVFGDRERQKTSERAVSSPRPSREEEWLRDLEDVVSGRRPNLMATTSWLARPEISFEDAVALVANGALQPPGMIDGDQTSAEVRQHGRASDKILRVSEIDPDRVRPVKDTLVAEVERLLVWDSYTEMSGGYKRNLVHALGAIHDPGLTGFFMNYCQNGSSVAKHLAKLGEAALSAAIRNLQDPAYADPVHADPICMIDTLTAFAKEIGSPDSVYSAAEKQRFLDLIRRDGLPAFRSSAFADWEWEKTFRPAFASPRPPAKGVPLNEHWLGELRELERLVSASVR